MFDPAAREVGLEGLVPHELRHTAASLAIASGASVKGVQAMLGHASATLTLDRYGHLFGDELDAVADRIDAAARTASLSAKQNAGLRLMTMSTQPISKSDKHLELPIEDLLRRARPLPSHDEMVIDDLDDEEGMAFLAALEE